MHHDKVADGIEDLRPVAVGLLDAGKLPGVFQGHGGVSRHGFQKDAIILSQSGGMARQTKHPGQFPFNAREAHERAVGPLQTGSRFPTEHLFRQTVHHGLATAIHELCQSRTQRAFETGLQQRTGMSLEGRIFPQASSIFFREQRLGRRNRGLNWGLSFLLIERRREHRSSLQE